MIITTHLVVGAAIAKTVPNPLLASGLAFASHFILDAIPHAQAPTDPGYIPNKNTYRALIIDVVLAFGFLLFLKLRGSLDWEILLIMFFGALPDLLDLTRYNKYFYKKFGFYYKFHDKIQRETTKPIGYLTQIVIIILGLWMIR